MCHFGIFNLSSPAHIIHADLILETQSNGFTVPNPFNGFPRLPNLQPHSLHLLKIHPPSTAGLRPFSRRAVLHRRPKRQRFPLRRRKRRSYAQGPLHASCPPRLLISLSLRHDNSSHNNQRPPHRLCRTWWLLHRRCHMLGCAIAWCSSLAADGSAGDRVVCEACKRGGVCSSADYGGRRW